MSAPLVSIIIAVKNGEKTLEKCLNAVLRIDYPDFEIIVVNDGSTDQTGAILKKYISRIRVIDFERSRGPSEARNIAAQQARGGYVAFTDADCLVQENWLSQLMAGFKEANAVSVGGIQEVPEDESNFGRLIARLMKKAGFITDYMRIAGDRIVYVNHNPSCNVVYSKDIFLKAGGFLPGLWPGEDVEFDYRLRKKGFKLAFNSKAIVYHYRPDNLKSFLKMMNRYGCVQGFLVNKNGFFRKIHFMPIITVITIIIFLFGFQWDWHIAFAVLFMLSFFSYVYFSSFKDFFLAISGFFFWQAGFLKGLLGFKR